ncbi:MAG: hypothetical protein ACXW48_23880, partial [Candidatus Binatia bacterium]
MKNRFARGFSDASKLCTTFALRTTSTLVAEFRGGDCDSLLGANFRPICECAQVVENSSRSFGTAETTPLTSTSLPMEEPSAMRRLDNTLLNTIQIHYTCQVVRTYLS